jgi:NhaC family Na+:H+ antiporter
MADDSPSSRNIKEPSYVDAIIPLLMLTVLIGGSVFVFGTDAIDGPMQVALIPCCMVVSLILLKNRASAGIYS